MIARNKIGRWAALGYGVFTPYTDCAPCTMMELDWRLTGENKA
jgi:hypothetical protein